jgi:hypothetical protein
MTLSDCYAAAQATALTAAAERALLAGEGTAASTGPTLDDLAAAHTEATRIDRYLDAVEAHAPAEIARLGAIYDATRDRAALRRLIVLQSCAEAVSDARAVLDDLPLLTDLIAAQNGGPLTAAMRSHGLVAGDHSGERLSTRAHSVLQLIAAAIRV